MKRKRTVIISGVDFEKLSIGKVKYPGPGEFLAGLMQAGHSALASERERQQSKRGKAKL